MKSTKAEIMDRVVVTQNEDGLYDPETRISANIIRDKGYWLSYDHSGLEKEYPDKDFRNLIEDDFDAEQEGPYKTIQSAKKDFGRYCWRFCKKEKL